MKLFRLLPLLAGLAGTACAAPAAVAGHAALARPFVRQLRALPPPSGRWRYYDGLLYFLGLLRAGGRFQAIVPPSPSS